MKTKLWIVLIIIAGLTVFPASIISAQGSDVEPNDTCAAAQYLGPAAYPLTVNGELAGYPLPTGDVDFFQFTGTPNTLLRVDLEGGSTGMGSLSDPYLGFFDSNCNPIAQNDDNGQNMNSRLLITIPMDGIAVLGVTRCCDSGFNEGGNGTYLLSVNEVAPPLNDDFASAVSVTSLPFDDIVDTSAATIEASEPTSSCAWWPGLVNTVWYKFTPAETRSYSASVPASGFVPTLAVYTGSSLDSLVEVGCRNYSDILTFRANAGTTYYFQLGSLYGYSQPGGTVQFHLDAASPPQAGICFYPSDPSSLETIQFYDCSYDPGGMGFQSYTWDFGDGATSTDYGPVHMYGKDGDFTVMHGVTTYDDRSASTSQLIQVRTHDVSITKLLTPKTAKAGQKKTITFSIKNNRYTEMVRIELYRSNGLGGYEFVGSLTKSVPAQKGNRTTQFSFNYTFTQQDARIGKVTFKAVVVLEGARDAFPFDNEIISMPPTVLKSEISYP